MPTSEISDITVSSAELEFTKYDSQIQFTLSSHLKKEM